MPSDLFTDDLSSLTNDELFAAIEEFAKTQKTEGWRHDYTEPWDDSSLKNIAAFANTFGGLLIVGVKKGQKDVACELAGVESQSEYKTRIASSIAANISPVPPYSIFECWRPGSPNKKFCVVRVRESRTLHLITKKGFDPVYVRNEDESRKADASQLRRLIDRERDMHVLAGNVSARADMLRKVLRIGASYQKLDSETWSLGPHQQSGTILKLEIIATDASPLEMEKSHEDWLKASVCHLYPRFDDNLVRGVALDAESRGAESGDYAQFYEYAVYHKELDFETKWRITSKGDIGCATQMNYRSTWSVVDLAKHLVLFIKLTMNWWRFMSYFGDGRLFAQLYIPGLSIAREPKHGYFTHGFDPTFTPASSFYAPSLRKDAISIAPSSRSTAIAEATVTFSGGRADSSRIATSILHRLLHTLGHSVVRDLLESGVKGLAAE